MKKYKGRFNPRRGRDRNCLYANEDEEFDEKGQSESDDELGFVAIKEDDLDREIREEKSSNFPSGKEIWLDSWQWLFTSHDLWYE